MAKSLIILPEAELDITEAYDWYQILAQYLLNHEATESHQYHPRSVDKIQPTFRS